MARKRYAEEVQQPQRFKRQCAPASPKRHSDPLAGLAAEFLQNFVYTCGSGATGVNDLVW